MNKFKKSVFTFLSLHILFLLLCAVAVYVMAFKFDPLHLYKPVGDLNTETFSFDSRLQNAGYIRNFDFDSVIIGNSHMENVAHSQIENIMGGKWFNLSMMGSSNNERKLILDDVFRRKNIKNVILLLNVGLYSNSTAGYEILYDDNQYNDVGIYFNSLYTKCFASWLIGAKVDPLCVGTNLDIDTHNAWIKDPIYAHRFNGMASWAQYYDDWQIINTYKLMQKLYDSPVKELAKLSPGIKKDIRNDFRKNIASLVEAHPNTTFYCYAQPLFKMAYAISIRENSNITIETYLEYLKIASEYASKHTNFKFFGFDNIPFTSDVKTYKDDSHFSPDRNYEVINYIKNNEYRLDATNVNTYIDEFIKSIKDYDLKSFKEEWFNLIEKNRENQNQ